VVLSAPIYSIVLIGENSSGKLDLIKQSDLRESTKPYAVITVENPESDEYVKLKITDAANFDVRTSLNKNFFR